MIAQFLSTAGGLLAAWSVVQCAILDSRFWREHERVAEHEGSSITDLIELARDFRFTAWVGVGAWAVRFVASLFLGPA